MIKAYFKFELLTDEVKLLNKVKVGAIVTRLDCTMYAGDYNGLEPFKNSKGQIFLYLTPSREFIEANCKRYAEYCLTNVNSLNFGSIYKYTNYSQFAYSYPNKKPFLANRQPNPLFPFGNDLYLMVKSPDYSLIEVFIIEGGRNYAESYLQCLIDGSFDLEIAKLRAESIPFYNYIGLELSNSNRY